MQSNRRNGWSRPAAGNGTWRQTCCCGRTTCSASLGLEPGAIAPTPDYILRPDPSRRPTAGRRGGGGGAVRGSSPDVIYRGGLARRHDPVLHGISTIVAEDEGGASRLVGSVQDITELTESQRKTAESLTLMETLQATAPVGFGFVDREFRIVRINETLPEIVGAPGRGRGRHGRSPRWSRRSGIRSGPIYRRHPRERQISRQRRDRAARGRIAGSSPAARQLLPGEHRDGGDRGRR